MAARRLDPREARICTCISYRCGEQDCLHPLTGIAKKGRILDKREHAAHQSEDGRRRVQAEAKAGVFASHNERTLLDSKL